MATVTLSSKHQITIPMEIVRAMGLKPGEKLIAEPVDWRIVLMKESENTIEQLKGSMKGVYGSTLEEIDRYVAEERRSPERDEWREQFYDLIARDPDAHKVVESLRRCPNRTGPEPDVLRIKGVTKRVGEAIKELVRHGGVRRIPAPPGVGAYEWQYRLVHEFAES